MITTINTIGSSRSLDNRSIPKTMLTPNQPSPEFKAKLKSHRLHQNKENRRNLSRKEKKTELCSVNKWSMVLPRITLDKSQPPRESHLAMSDTGEILRRRDGPTASFPLPCSSRWQIKMQQVMALMAEVLLKDRCHKATGERLQASLLEHQAGAISQCRSPKLPL